MRYRVHKTALIMPSEPAIDRWVIVDTINNDVIKAFGDPLDAHEACGKLNFKHKAATRHATDALDKMNDFA